MDNDKIEWTNLVWIPFETRVYRNGWKRIIDIIFPRFEKVENGGRFVATDGSGRVFSSKNGVEWTIK